MTAMKWEVVCHRLGMSLRAGLPPVDAIRAEAEAASGDDRRAWRRIESDVVAGDSIADAMEATGLVPPLVVGSTRVGEQTGRVDETLLR